MSDPFFFGYGSLVNRYTHDFTEAYQARVKGWRRAWRHTSLRDVAFLSAIPCSDSEIDGLIAAVPQGNWKALDEREWAYLRHHVSDCVSHKTDRDLHIEIYAIPSEHSAKPSTRHPILLSYIDVVVQGYLHVFGEAGAERFFATTEGWDTPVLNDRQNPRYPRAQKLSLFETDFVNAHLARYGAVITEE